MFQKKNVVFCNWYFRAKLDENYDADRRFFYFYALFDQMTKSYTQEKRKNLAEQGLQFAGGEQGLMQAYRQTKAEFINSDDYAHPYYWAAFVLYE